MAGLTWLHLSDWHQKEKDFDREVVRDKLIEDFERRTKISPDLEKVDFIIFSGDVANSAKPEEYLAAKEELFDRVLKATRLSSDKLFIVPGNHDLNRDDLEYLPPSLSKPFSSNAEIQKWLDDKRMRNILLGPFHAFSDFVTTLTGQDKPDYANVRITTIDNKTIALLGLNSAWMCGRNLDSGGKVDDERHVLVGEPQIHRCLKKISKADVRIAILHHPFEWLAKFDRDRVESRLMRETDFILRGHQHQPQVSVIKSTLGDCVIIPAGASYNRRNVDDLRYSNAYNFVHLDFDSGNCVVFLRCWSDSLNRWREDIDSQPPNGRFDFTIPKYISARIDPDDCSQEDSTDYPRNPSPSEASSTQNLHQIPSPPADFTGRDDDLKDLLDHFNQGVNNQGATITGLRGMGGIGKTALAYKLAEKLTDRYPDGQILVDMNGTSEVPLTAAGAMAQVIHAYDPEARLALSVSELSGLYRSKLHNKKVLILLDNAINDNQVRPLLPPSSCGLIVTSREKFTLPGLKEKDLNIMPISDACALLLKIAKRIGGHAEELADLCGRLPLALRAASSLLANEHDLSLAEYLRDLRIERTRLERIGGEGVDRDVTASFNLSYRRLKPDEASVFRLLSIFPADFDANAEEYLCKDKGHKRLSKLVRWSLVDFYERNSRYRLHDLTRIFAGKSLLKKDGEAVHAMAMQRYFVRYLNVLSNAHDLYEKGGENIILGLEILDRELANIQAGQVWVEKNAKTNVNAAALCINYAYSASILSLRLHPHNLIRWLEVSLEAAKRLDKPAQEGAILTSMGNAYCNIGEVRKAIVYHDQALGISREMGNRQGEEVALCNLGTAYRNLGDVRKAIQYNDQARAISHEIRDRRGEGAVLGNMGLDYADLGEVRKAIEYYEQALAINQEIGDRQSERNQLGNLGNAYYNLGDVRKAIKYHEQTLAISQEIGDRRTEGAVLGNIGLAYADLGEVRKAIKYYERALAISREIGDRRCEGNNLGNMGRTHADLGDVRRAIDYYDQALAISQEIGDRMGEGVDLGNLGSAYAALGETRKAIEYYEQALAISHEIEDPSMEGENLINFGKAYAALGETDKAIGYYEQSLEIVRRIEDRKNESKALCNLGKAYANLGEARKAIDYFKQSLEIARKIEYYRGEGDALFNMSLALDKLGQRQEAIDRAKAVLVIFEQIESPNAEKARQKLAEWQG